MVMFRMNALRLTFSLNALMNSLVSADNCSNSSADTTNGIDGTVPAGFVGGQAPSPWGGYDWRKLSKAVQWVECYDIGHLYTAAHFLADFAQAPSPSGLHLSGAAYRFLVEEAFPCATAEEEEESLILQYFPLPDPLEIV